MLPVRRTPPRPEPRVRGEEGWITPADRYVAAICEPLAALAEVGLVEVSPSLLDTFCDLRTVENLVLFGIVVSPAGRIVNLPEDHAKVWADIQPKLAALKGYLANLPGFGRGAADAPHWLSNMRDDKGFDRVMNRVSASPERRGRVLMLRRHEAVSTLAGARPAL